MGGFCLLVKLLWEVSAPAACAAGLFSIWFKFGGALLCFCELMQVFLTFLECSTLGSHFCLLLQTFEYILILSILPTTHVSFFIMLCVASTFKCTCTCTLLFLSQVFWRKLYWSLNIVMFIENCQWKCQTLLENQLGLTRPRQASVQKVRFPLIVVQMVSPIFFLLLFFYFFVISSLKF